MLRSLIAYDAAGNIVGVLNHIVAKDEDGEPGLVDFAAHEDAGGRLRDIWTVDSAIGSASWPEWLESRVYDFTVELESDPSPARARIKALVHKKSGHRRERSAIEAEIEKRISAKRDEAKKRGDEMRKDLKRRGLAAEMVELVQDPEPEAADLRDLLGGPNRPLLLNEDGSTRPRSAKSRRPALPVVRRAQGHP